MGLLSNLMAGLGLGPRRASVLLEEPAVALAAVLDPGDLERVGPPLEPQAPHLRHGGIRDAYSVSRHSKGITPQRIGRALDQAAAGEPGPLCELLHEIERKDLHIQAQLGKRRRAVTRFEWWLEPGSDRAADRRVAERVEASIRAIPGLRHAMRELLDALSKGFAVCELDWAVDGGQAYVRRFERRPQWWFKPDEDAPDTWRVLTAQDWVDGEPLNPARFIVHEAVSGNGWPWEGGLGTGLIFFWMLKRYGFADWGGFMELFGQPYRVGRFDHGAKADDIRRLEQALDRIGLEAWAAIPEGMDIEFIQAQGSSATGPQVYERMIALCDEQITIGILGQSLTTNPGDKGTQALGTIHEGVLQRLVEDDAEDLAETLTHQLVAPLAIFNHGADVALPRWRFDTTPPKSDRERDESRESRGRVFVQALNLGLEVPLGQIREELDIREPARGEDIVTLLPVVADGGAEGVRANRVQVSCCGLDQRDHLRGPRAWHNPALRPLAAGESGPEWLRQVELAAERYRREGGQAAWDGLVAQMKAGLLAAGSLEVMDEAFVGVVRTLDLEPLARQLADATMTADLVAQLQAQAGDQLVTGLPDVPPREAVDFWKTKLSMTSSAFYALDEAHRARAFTIAGYSSLSALDQARTLMGDLLLSGGTMAEFEDGLAALGHGALGPRHLRLVWQNNVATAINVGRHTQLTRPATKERRPYWRYNTVGDSKVRPAHENMALRIWQADNAIWAIWYPPNGHGCRCWVTAHTAEEVQAAGWELEDGLPLDLGTGGPLLPDEGWRRNPAQQPHEPDFTRFPPEWLTALGLEM